jgi:hypothetical protein
MDPAPEWFAISVKKRDRTVWNGLIKRDVTTGVYTLSVEKLQANGTGVDEDKFEFTSLAELV